MKLFLWLGLFVVLIIPILGRDILPIVTGAESPPYVPTPKFSASDIQNAFAYAEQKAQERQNIENNLAKNGRVISKSSISAEARHQRFNAIDPKSVKKDTNQKIFEEASNYLANKYGLSYDQRVYGLPKVLLPGGSSKAQQAVSSCQSLNQQPRCSSNSVFRTADGTCNNLNIDPRWGQSFTSFNRLLGPAYADGLNAPRVAVDGGPLPNARVVSTTIHPDIDVPATQYTLMTMQWGQFMDHDLTLTPMTRAANMDMIECCPVQTTAQHPGCFPIELPPGDSFFAPRGQSCLNFVRSAASTDGCTLGPRQQTNQLTAFIDASQVYGSDKNGSDVLRAFRNGLLTTQTSRVAGELLPPSLDPVNDQCSRQEGQPSCFRAGDERVNEQPGLTCLHTIWVRQHNRIAGRLRELYPQENDESIYQYSRKIVGAQLQRITYGEFLPVVLGQAYMDYFGLNLSPAGQTTNYNPNIQPIILHEFATAAYRMGHTLINNIFPEYDSRYRQYSFLNLSENFFFPFSVFNNELPDIVRGLTVTPAQQFDRFVVSAVTNNLYKQRGTPFGMDLVALNLQRGRDHGIHGYVDYVNFCFGNQINSFQDLTKFMPVDNVKKLQSVYKNIYDIDLFSAGILETPLSGAVVGPTFGCIIGIQFARLKYGDRFYFEHQGVEQSSQTFPNFFSTAQIDEIRHTPWSRVLCVNGGIDRIKFNAFLPGGSLYYCDQLPEMNLDYF